MKKEKTNIKEALNHIKNSINKNTENVKKNEDTEEFILLKKVIKKSNKTKPSVNNINAKTDNAFIEVDNSDKKFDKKIINKTNLTKKNIETKTSNSHKKPKDPVAALVDREIKPIIKKWISKNLKSFVKTIVMQEMKLISKATQKHK